MIKRPVTLARPLNLQLGLSFENRGSQNTSSLLSFVKSTQSTREQVSFSLPSVSSLNEIETVAQRNRSRSVGEYSSFRSEPLYATVKPSNKVLKLTDIVK